VVVPTGWVRFDMVARDAATAAYVAMWLRERLPMATIRSEPDPKRSDDPVRPHVLKCRAWISGHSGIATAQAIASVSAIWMP
jgi:hypothetical protein